MTTEPTPDSSNALGAHLHQNCVVCGRANDRGLHVQFVSMADGSVRASFGCSAAFEGYAGSVHGGVISALLDGAMTHCIFAQGLVGVTGELKVRYRHPVLTDRLAVVYGRIMHAVPPLYLMEAELVQDDRIKVTATAKFMAQAQPVERK